MRSANLSEALYTDLTNTLFKFVRRTYIRRREHRGTGKPLTRETKLDAIKVICQVFIGGPLQMQLQDIMTTMIADTGLVADGARIEIDHDDASRQSLLLWYPSVTAASDSYIRKAVKIESGAKSALHSHQSRWVAPYVNDDLSAFALEIDDVTIVDAERTFWDKVVILHGLRRWFGKRELLRAGGQRVSRHYYDVHMLMAVANGDVALANQELCCDCVTHARLFFNSPDLDLAHAEPGSFALIPSDVMTTDLRRDYNAMASMIFGEIPAFDDILATVSRLEAQINGYTA